jgi:hypothetical protein
MAFVLAPLLLDALPAPVCDSATCREGLRTNVELHAGVASAPFYSVRERRAEGRGGALVFGGSWQWRSGFGVGLSVPLVFVRLSEPATADRNEPAWGNPLFLAERRVLFTRDPAAGDRVEGWFRLGVGAPLADMGPPRTLSKNRALAVADALRGFEDGELFTPGVVPFTATAGLAVDDAPFRGETSVKLTPMVRIDDAYLPEAFRHSFAFSAIAKAGGSLWPVPELGIGAVAFLVIDAAPPVDFLGAHTLQFVLSPNASYKLGAHVSLDTGFVIPIGGALGGNTLAFDVRAAVTW